MAVQAVAPSSSRAPIFPAAVLLVVAVLAAYANSFSGPFVFDDPSSIIANPTIRHLGWSALAPPTAGVTVEGRPILNLSLALDYAMSGPAVWSYHVTNVVIQALATLVLFGLVRRTWLLRAVRAQPLESSAGNQAGTPRRDAVLFGFAVAILWGLHPVQTEAVTYVIQRAESLMGLFFLLTFYCFARSATAPHPARWLVLAAASCTLGAATKEVTAVAPVLLWLYDRTFVSGQFGTALRRHRWTYLALVATWGLSAWLVLGTGGNRAGSVGFDTGIAWSAYWLTQLPALAHYLWLSVWPAPLVFEYGTFWVEHIGDLAITGPLVLGLGAGTLLALRQAPILGFLGSWFFLILAPTSLMPGTTQMIVEHRLYLSLAALVVALLGLAYHFAGRRGLMAALVLAAAFGGLTARRNVDYRSETDLWRDTVAKRPANPLAHQMLAMALDQAGDLAAAKIHYELALQLKPNFALAHDLLGQLLFRTGDRADATAHYELAVQLQPTFADAHDHLAVALAQQRRYPDALAEHQIALRLKPDFPEAHFNFANSLAATGRTAEAIAQYQTALQLKPNYPAAEYNLANTLVDTGKSAEAIPHYQAAIRLRSDYAAAYNNLGGAFLDLGRIVDATAAYEAALRINPNFTNARDNLARIRAATR